MSAALFSELAPLWEGHDRERAESLCGSARRVVRNLRTGGHVLDVGCGTGALLARIRAEARARGKRIGRVVGIDPAHGMVARTNQRRGVRALPADGLWLPFADQVFDVVIASHVLHLMADPVRAAREMYRVLAPGGTIIVELPTERTPGVLRAARRLPRTSLLRRYIEVPRRHGVAAFRAALSSMGCEVSEVVVRAPHADGERFLARVARASGTPEDLMLARELRNSPERNRSRVITARLPGPRTGSMPVRVVGLKGWDERRVRRLLRGLPEARGYSLLVKPLRYRKRPHVQAFCEFDNRRIIVQVPVPFLPFDEPVPFRARRIGTHRGFRFRWYRRWLRFDRPDELIRYLYLHEYYHWYLREVRGRRSGAETACDRFALQRL